MRKHIVTLVVCGCLAAAIDAAAQSREWTERGYANLSLGFQAGSGDIDATQEVSIYQETGRINVNQQIEGGLLFDLSAGVRVWRNVSVGLGYTHLGSDGDAAVSGSWPHPLFTDRFRDFTAEARALERSENALHLSFGYMFPINDKLDVHVMGGPSFFWLSQEVVSEVQVAEAGAPFTSVVVSPQLAKRKENPVGGHIGVDANYRMFERGPMKIGVGGFLRYAAASSDLRVVDTDADADVGGFQIGVGIRTRF